MFRSLHFLTHRRPTLRNWRHIDPSPHPSLVKDVQSGAKMFQLHFNIVFFGGERGSMLSELCFTGMYSEIRHTTWGICLNTFVQDRRFLHYLLFSLPNGSTYNLRSSAAPLFFVPKESRTFQHSVATVSI